MKKRISPVGWFLTALLAAALTLTAGFIFTQYASVHTAVRVETQANNTYRKTIVVTADCDYDPYSFYDAQGEPSGLDVELINELANRMGYNVELRLLPWAQAMQAAETGEADLVMAMAYKDGTTNGLSLSVPLVNDPFVAFGKEQFTRIGELYGKRIAVLAGTGCIDGFIRPYRLSSTTTAYPSVSEVFDAVNDGRADYAVVRFSVGRRAMANKAYNGISAVGPTLLNNYLCIGISKNNSVLAQELDSAIIDASSDGTLAELSSKWLGRYVDTLTFREFLSANKGTLFFAIAMILILFFICTLVINRYISRNRERMLTQLAQQDRLTGLYNRSACEGYIRTTLEGSDPARDVHALLVMDVDNFKRINDTYGHLEGDAALVSLADTLRRIFRQSDITGRLGGDEFFVFMPNCSSADSPMKKAAQIGLLFGEPREIGGDNTRLTASIGVALYPSDGVTFTELYKGSDDALYEAKRCGKNGYAMTDEKGVIRFYPNAPQ